MADPRIQVDGREISIAPEDYDHVIGSLQEQERPFEILAETEEIVPSKAFQARPMDVEGLKGSRDDPAFDAAYEAEKATKTLPEHMAPENLEATERGIRRVAQEAMNKRPNQFIPGGGAGGQGKLDMSSMMMEGMPFQTHKYFEPSLESVIESTNDPEDKQSLMELGKESPAWLAITNARWKIVHDVFQKNNEPVIRVEAVDEKGAAAANKATQMAGDIHKKYTVPFALGMDELAMAGAVKHLAGAAMGEYQESPAVKELEKMGVYKDAITRLEDLGEDSPVMRGLGGLAAALSSGGASLLPNMLAAGGKKAAAAAGAKGIAASGLAGTAAVGGEIAAQEAVEMAAEGMGARENVDAPAADVAMEMAMGGLGSTVLEGVGKGARKYQRYLRDETTEGADDLNLLESLKGAAEGKRKVRGTSITGKQGIDPGKVVREEHERLAKQYEGRDIAGSSVQGVRPKSEDMYREPVNEVVKELDTRTSSMKERHMLEAEEYYMTPEAEKTVSVMPILGRLDAMLSKRQASSLSDVVEIGEAGSRTDLPIVDNKLLKKTIEQFEKVDGIMDAEGLDQVIRSVDGVVQANKANPNVANLFKDVQVSLREVRLNNFKKNALLKSKQHTQITKLEKAQDRMGLQYTATDKMDLASQRKRAIDAVKTLGTDVDSLDVLRVLDQNPKLKKKLLEVIANEPYKRLTGGELDPATRASVVRGAIQQSKYRLDPIAEMLGDALVSQGPKVSQAAAGTGAERAMAMLGNSEEERDTIRTMLDALFQEEAKNNEDRR